MNAVIFRVEGNASMTIRNFQRWVILLGLAFCPVFLASGALAQDAASPARLSLSEVVERLTANNALRAAELAGYTSQRTYDLDYKGFPHTMHAELVVELNYKAPNTENFTVLSETGPKWMVNLVLKRLLETERESIEDKNRAGVQITSQNYNFTMVPSQDTGDGCSYVLDAAPKVPSKFLFRGRVWINDKDFAVCRIAAEPAKNPSFW
ncbi:MAG: hypothetical protein ACRD4Y_17675, partial [Candidatus Acidiferrales bacterium]